MKHVLAALALLALSASLCAADARPLTRKQYESYKEIRALGIDKRTSRRVARDPGVKKNQWGWVCSVNPGPVIEHKRIEGAGAKYKRNAVCE